MRVKVLAIFRWCERTNSSPYGDSGSYLCNTKLEFPDRGTAGDDQENGIDASGKRGVDQGINDIKVK